MKAILAASDNECQMFPYREKAITTINITNSTKV